MGQHAELAVVATRWQQTHVVFSIGPVDADESGTEEVDSISDPNREKEAVD